MYTNLILFALGVFGILIHNLIKINQVNRSLDGNFKLMPFIKLEWPSISLSLCAVFVVLIAKHEVKQLEQVREWLGIFMVFTGYAAQSLIYATLGRAEKSLKKDD